MTPSRLLPPTSPLRALSRQRRFVRERLRIIVPKNDYYVQAECVAALRALGHEVVEVMLGERGEGVDVPRALQRLLRACVRVRPDMLFSVNYTGFDRALWLNEVIEAMALPTAVWFVDSPFLLALGYLPPVPGVMKFFAWDRSYVNELQRMGAGEVGHLPLATCPKIFSATAAKPTAASLPLSFVGHSLQILVEIWQQRIDPALLPQARAWAERLGQDRSSLHTLVPQPTLPVDPRIATLGLANSLASAALRERMLRRLDGPQLFVFGDEAFARSLPRSKLAGTCAYGTETARIYRHTAVNVNVTNLQMPTAVNQRVFDVPACGAFLLTDRQDELCDYFEPETQMATFASGDELSDKAAYYVRQPERRAQLVARAQKRVLAEHTYVHRMRALVASMRQHHGRFAVLGRVGPLSAPTAAASAGPPSLSAARPPCATPPPLN